MMEFFTALVSKPFVQKTVIAGVLSSIACGVTGTFVVIKRIAFISGGIAHAVMGGLGIALFLGWNPLIGALIFAVLSAALITLFKFRFSQNLDTLVGALWAIGMAIGVIFIALTPGIKKDLSSYLFGNILLVNTESLIILAVLDFILLLLVLIFYRQFLYLSFDEEYAKVRGIPVTRMTLLLLTMVSVSVVILIQTVGIILVIALLTLPSATAGLFSKSTGRMIVLSTLICLFVLFFGYWSSFSIQNLPTGPVTILVAAVIYIIALVGHRIYTRKKSGIAPGKKPASD
jgi:zinc transport system permease protein